MGVGWVCHRNWPTRADIPVQLYRKEGWACCMSYVASFCCCLMHVVQFLLSVAACCESTHSLAPVQAYRKEGWTVLLASVLRASLECSLAEKSAEAYIGTALHVRSRRLSFLLIFRLFVHSRLTYRLVLCLTLTSKASTVRFFLADSLSPSRILRSSGPSLRLPSLAPRRPLPSRPGGPTLPSVGPLVQLLSCPIETTASGEPAAAAGALAAERTSRAALQQQLMRILCHPDEPLPADVAWAALTGAARLFCRLISHLGRLSFPTLPSSILTAVRCRVRRPRTHLYVGLRDRFVSHWCVCAAPITLDQDALPPLPCKVHFGSTSARTNEEVVRRAPPAEIRARAARTHRRAIGTVALSRWCQTYASVCLLR